MVRPPGQQDEGAARSGNPIPVQPWAAGPVHRICSIKHRFFSSVSMVTSHRQNPPPRGWGRAPRPAPRLPGPLPSIWGEMMSGGDPGRGAVTNEVHTGVVRRGVTQRRSRACLPPGSVFDVPPSRQHFESVTKRKQHHLFLPVPGFQLRPQACEPRPLPRGCLPVLPRSGGSSVGGGPVGSAQLPWASRWRNYSTRRCPTAALAVWGAYVTPSARVPAWAPPVSSGPPRWALL